MKKNYFCSLETQFFLIVWIPNVFYLLRKKASQRKKLSWVKVEFLMKH